ncbi:receptor expression-enhancing protein 4-like [Ctenocephalides felis]|uniref:receptor expression-enhancing protein 4-like n=1 Tax=Ctenocephalides felis TaxID=7515 RepID=UPI000E6E14BD|nr:receptor expression-enhancing protein 4-like [Ctenocephalides felis]
MFSALLARLIFLIFGCTYPIYKSYKILSNPLCDYDVLQQLYGQVKFFVVFCAYVALECITDTFLFWVPFYYEVKIGFLAWVTSPISGGAVKIYDHFVEPMIRLKEPQIERFVVKCSAIGYGSCYQFSMRLASRILSTVLDAALRPAARVSTEMNAAPLRLTERSYNNDASSLGEGSFEEDESTKHDAILKRLKDLRHLRKSHSANT